MKRIKCQKRGSVRLTELLVVFVVVALFGLFGILSSSSFSIQASVDRISQGIEKVKQFVGLSPSSSPSPSLQPPQGLSSSLKETTSSCNQCETVTATTFRSVAPSGTPPLIVFSDEEVQNLNANYLQGHPASYFQPAGNYLTDLYASSPLSVSSSGSVWSLSLSKATATSSGYLSSSDWLLFYQKEPAISSGSTTQYFRGDKTWQTLNQSAVLGLTTADSPTFFGLTLSSLTSGSVLFVGASGAISQNNNQFFWDDTNGRLGIGTNTPQSQLDVRGGVAIGSYAGSSAAPTNGLIVSGRLGLGTSSPSYTLDVSGSGIVARFSGRVIGGEAVNDNEFVTLAQVLGGSASYWGRNSSGYLYPLAAGDDIVKNTSGDLGLSSSPWDNLYVNNIQAGTGTLTIGAFTLGGAVTGNLTLSGHILPGTDNTYDLGSATQRWRDLYLGPSSLKIYNTYTDASNYELARLYFNSNVLTLSTSASGTGTLRPIQITTGSNTGIYIDTSGRVGIGTTEPNSALSVVGNISMQSSSKIGINPEADFGSGFVGIQFVSGELKLAPRPNLAHWIGISTDGSLYVVGNANSAVFGQIVGYNLKGVIQFTQGGWIKLNLQGEYYPAIVIDPTGSVGIGGTEANTSPKMYVNSSGSVGINTTSPSAKLHVVATDEQLRLGYNTSNAVKFTVGSDNSLTITPLANSTTGFSFTNAAGTSILNIDTSNQRVGIGTTSPSYTLDVSGTGRISTSLTTPLILGSSSLALRPSSDSTTAIQLQNAAGTSILNIDTTNQYVGINTTSSSYPLQVTGLNTEATLGSELVSNGTFDSSSSWTFGTGWSWDSVNLEADHTTGNTAALEQNIGASSGKVYYLVFTVRNRTAGSVTPYIGGAAGSAVSSNTTSSQYIIATGSGNLQFVPSSDFNGSIDDVSVKEVLPSSAIAAFTSSSSSAKIEIRTGANSSTNLFIGQDSGKYTYHPSSDYGLYNTGIGYRALYRNTTGRYNTAIGSYALSNFTYGEWNNTPNTAIGAYALANATRGYGNTAVGYGTLRSLTTSCWNVAVGHYALYNNDAIYNVAVGAYALISNTSGRENTAIGTYALYSNTTGRNNTALGTWAIRDSSSGSYNVAVGWGSLRSNNGSANVAIGGGGWYGGALAYNTTGSYNVALGFYAGYYETGSHKLYIANNQHLANALIYGEFDNKRLALLSNVTVANPYALGSEKAANGSFSTVPDTSWTWGSGWSHDTTSLEADHTTGNTAALEQNISAVAGEIYYLSFTVRNRTAGSVTPYIGGVAGTAVNNNVISTQIITATGTDNLRFVPSSDFNGSIDDVSVKRITGGDLAVAGIITGGGSSGLKVDTSGNVGIGVSTPGGGTGSYVLSLYNSSAAPTALSNTTHLYSSEGEGYWMDAAGNITLQTPHDPETGEWIFLSHNTNTQKKLKVNMERLTKELDKLLGGGYVFENEKPYFEGEGIQLRLERVERELTAIKEQVNSLYQGKEEGLDVRRALSLAITTKKEDYLATENDYTILCDASDKEVIIRLPETENAVGRVYVVKKVDASEHRCLVQSSKGETIDSEREFSLVRQWQAVTLQSDGRAWFVVGKVE